MRLDVVHATSVHEGDVVVGAVVPEAPTRPVQPLAAGLTVLRTVPRRNPITGRKETQFYYDDNAATGLLRSPWFGIGDLIMVVRDNEVTS